MVEEVLPTPADAPRDPLDVIEAEVDERRRNWTPSPTLDAVLGHFVAGKVDHEHRFKVDDEIILPQTVQALNDVEDGLGRMYLNHIMSEGNHRRTRETVGQVFALVIVIAAFAVVWHALDTKNPTTAAVVFGATLIGVLRLVSWAKR